MPVKWSDPRSPTEGGCRYNHVTADTPLGTITIEWKGWKDRPSFTCELPWGELVTGDRLVHAQGEVQMAWNEMAERVAVLATN